MSASLSGGAPPLQPPTACSAAVCNRQPPHATSPLRRICHTGNVPAYLYISLLLTLPACLPAVVPCLAAAASRRPPRPPAWRSVGTTLTPTSPTASTSTSAARSLSATSLCSACCWPSRSCRTRVRRGGAGPGHVCACACVGGGGAGGTQMVLCVFLPLLRAAFQVHIDGQQDNGMLGAMSDARPARPHPIPPHRHDRRAGVALPACRPHRHHRPPQPRWRLAEREGVERDLQPLAAAQLQGLWRPLLRQHLALPRHL